MSQVDRTKPSTACEPCRKSKSKCDRKRPSCSQCIRNTRACFGYREDLDLVLRNENDKVQLRVAGKRGTNSKGSSSLSSSSRAVSRTQPVRPASRTVPRQVSTVRHQMTLTATPSQSDVTVAANFFFSNFAQGIYLDYLPDLYRQDDRTKILETSFEAVCLSYLARCKNSPSMSRTALLKYSQALRETQESISTLPNAVQDHTIASVMLLALFAAFSSEPSEATHTWTRHVDGAVAMIQLRSPDSFGSYRSQVLLNHVLSSYQLSCFRREISLPAQMPSLYKLSALAQDAFQVQFWRLIEAVTTLREACAHGHLIPEVVIEQASRLDIWAIGMLDALPNKPKAVADRIGAPNLSQIHRITRAQNTIRMIRMELNSLIAEYGKLSLSTELFLDEIATDRLSIRIENAEKNVNDVATDVCNGIEHFLSGVKSKINRKPNDTVWICGFILPLSVALNLAVLSAQIKDRIQVQLKKLSDISENVHVSQLISQSADGKSPPDCASVLFLC